MNQRRDERMAGGATRAGVAWWLAVLLAAAVLAGCNGASRQPVEVRTAPTGPRYSDPLNPAADRLHEISGALLLYYVNHRALPEQIDELKPLLDDPSMELRCPISGFPYLYTRQGLRVAGVEGHIVILDAQPSQASMRWAITVVEPPSGNVLLTKVVVVREQLIRQALLAVEQP